MRLRILALLFLVSPLSPPLGAQELLDQAETFLDQGFVFRARDRVDEWWYNRRAEAGRTELQRGIWLRGRLTVDPSLAALDFRRLVLEFPGGPYTDDALHRLAMEAELRGDLGQAATYLRTLARDYPTSRFQVLASSWLRENEGRLSDLGTEPENEPGNQAAGEAPGSIPESVAAPDSAGSGVFSLQLGAFQNLDGARRLLEELRQSGYDARLVRLPGSALVRVRLGRFQGRDGVRELQRELNQGGWVSTVVSNAGDEEKIG